MDRALKSNFLTKFAMKSTQQVLFDDLFYVNGVAAAGGGGGVSCDDFSVDTFLDLSNNDFNDEGFVGEEEEGEEQGKGNSSSSNFSGSFDSGSLPAGELSVPVEDIDQLEWLSQFVDDSPSELSLLYPPTGICKGNGGNGSKNPFERAIKPLARSTPILQFPCTVPSKPRSKRSRPSRQPWSTALLLLNQSPSSANVKPASKKQRKWPAGEGGGSQQPQRRCSHCHVQKTPQWRSGPLGEKTLCNACGVRYKSGRLFPEYRPACSPTFLESVHSNSHRKVLEMRMKKEVVGPGSDLAPMVPNLELHLDRIAGF